MFQAAQEEHILAGLNSRIEAWRPRRGRGEWPQVDPVGYVHEQAWLRTQSQQTFTRKPANRHQGIRALQCLQESSVKPRANQALVAVPDIAAVAGNHRRNSEPL